LVLFKLNTDEKEVYQKLIELGKSKGNSEVTISKVAEYIDYPSNKVKAKVLWMLGEIGLKNPQIIESLSRCPSVNDSDVRNFLFITFRAPHFMYKNIFSTDKTKTQCS